MHDLRTRWLGRLRVRVYLELLSQESWVVMYWVGALADMAFGLYTVPFDMNIEYCP